MLKPLTERALTFWHVTVNGRLVELADFEAMDKAEIRTVDASGCTALTGYIGIGENARGYEMYAIRLGSGDWRIIAGCRYFTLDQARKHWGPGSARAHPEILAQVAEIAAEIERREVALAPEAAVAQ